MLAACASKPVRHAFVQLRNIQSAGSEQECRSIRNGQVFSLVKSFSQEDVSKFLEVTGDTNSIHTDASVAKSAGFNKPILPGILCASLFPAIIARQFPAALYLTQTLKFRQAAPVGSRIYAQVKVLQISGNNVKFTTFCTTEDGTVIVDGVALARISERGRKESLRQ